MKYIFISPHIDDAFLSSGGLISKLINEKKSVRIDYIFSLSEWTNPQNISGLAYKKDVSYVSGLRKSEELLITQSLQYECNFLDYSDLPLRNTHDRITELAILEKIKNYFLKSIKRSDCCFFPVGIDHYDHIIIREIGEGLFNDGYNIIFYEDLPYLAFGGYDLLKFHQDVSSYKMIKKNIIIDNYVKKAILFNYKSQVSFDWIKDITNYSYNPTDNTFVERYWSKEACLDFI